MPLRSLEPDEIDKFAKMPGANKKFVKEFLSHISNYKEGRTLTALHNAGQDLHIKLEKKYPDYPDGDECKATRAAVVAGLKAARINAEERK